MATVQSLCSSSGPIRNTSATEPLKMSTHPTRRKKFVTLERSDKDGLWRSVKMLQIIDLRLSHPR